MNSKNVSAHLAWSEIACHDADSTPYPLAWRASRAVKLAAAFEAIRAEWEEPILIRSGYRTPQFNASLPGAAPASQHTEGRALDLAPPDGVTVYDFWTRIVEIAGRIGLGGIGYAPPSQGNYVHVDIRPMPAGQIAQWTYPYTGVLA